MTLDEAIAIVREHANLYSHEQHALVGALRLVADAAEDQQRTLVASEALVAVFKRFLNLQREHIATMETCFKEAEL